VLVASEPESENDADADADADNEADSTDWHELHDRTLLIVEQGRITTSALGGDPQEGAA
jgi:hypothetical protein